MPSYAMPTSRGRRTPGGWLLITGPGRAYDTAVFYQLEAGHWRLLRSPEADETTRPVKDAQDAQAQKLKLPEDAYRRRTWDTWTIRRWVNAGTAELYVFSDRLVTVPKTGETTDLTGHFLHTLKFDVRGRWKIARTRKMTAAEVEKMDAEE